MEGSPQLLYLPIPPPGVPAALCLTAMISQHGAIRPAEARLIGQCEGGDNKYQPRVAIPPWPGVSESQEIWGRDVDVYY
jgi:hypothetical protein